MSADESTFDLIREATITAVELRRRCAEAEAERDAALAQTQRYNELQFHACVERDAALAEVERLEEALRSLTAYSAEVGAPRAELAARPDLTELRELVQAWRECGCYVACCHGEAVAQHADTLFVAADPAPAPDTVPSLTVGDSDQPWVQVPCPNRKQTNP